MFFVTAIIMIKHGVLEPNDRAFCRTLVCCTMLRMFLFEAFQSQFSRLIRPSDTFSAVCLLNFVTYTEILLLRNVNRLIH